MGDIALYVFDGMADYEITLLSHMLSTGTGKRIIAVSGDLHPVSGRSGLRYLPDITVNDAFNYELEALIIPGGWENSENTSLVDLIQKIHREGGILAAICAGPRYLAKAGLLCRYRYTTSVIEWTEEHMKRFGENDPFPRSSFINSRLVKDRNIITAQGKAYIDFTIQICRDLSMFESEEEIQRFIEDITSMLTVK